MQLIGGIATTGPTAPPAPRVYSITQWKLILLLVVVAAIALVVTAIPLVVLNPANQDYAASVGLTRYQTWSSYQGQTPVRWFFLVANVTVENTGPVPLSIPGTEWLLTDDLGNTLAQADARFYSAPTLPRGQSIDLTLVFDVAGNAVKIALTLPNGYNTAVLLSSAREYYSATLASDGVQYASSYAGQSIPFGYYMLVNATLANTGPFVIAPTSGTWFLTNVYGTDLGGVDDRIYEPFAVQPGAAAQVRLAFTPPIARPTYLGFRMPNGTVLSAPLGPFPVAYNATLAITGSYITATYQGQNATSGQFMVVNVTLRNTGAVTLYPLQWILVTVSGKNLGAPDSRFYGQPVVPTGQSLPITLVFDGAAPPDAPHTLMLDFPDGSFVVTTV